MRSNFVILEKGFELMRWFLVVLSGILIFTFLLPLSTSQSYAQSQYRTPFDSAPSCTQTSIPVTLSPLDSTVYHVVTWLCSQGPVAGKTVQVLVHGGTYDHTYWDFPLSPQTYSYVSQITNAGYVALNFDRIGIGLSDTPPALQVTVQSNAYVVHQLIQDLRNGSFNGVSFAKVMLAGHSFGSATVVAEASQYADVDGVIITGDMHTVNVVGASSAISSL